MTRVLLVLPTRKAVQASRLRPASVIAASPHVQSWTAWSPDMDMERLRGTRFDVVVVDSHVPRHADNWPRDREIIHGYSTHADTVWVGT